MVSDIELRLEPKQVLQVSPQMLLATRMLLMPAQELSDYLARAAEENPLLERLEPCGFSSGCERMYAVETPHTAEDGRWGASMTSLAASLTEQIERLRQDFAFEITGHVDDDHEAGRFVCSWATKEEAVDALIAAL